MVQAPRRRYWRVGRTLRSAAPAAERAFARNPLARASVEQTGKARGARHLIVQVTGSSVRAQGGYATGSGTSHAASLATSTTSTCV